MTDLIEQHRKQVAALCRRTGARPSVLCVFAEQDL
jgi:hypothetical protein